MPTPKTIHPPKRIQKGRRAVCHRPRVVPAKKRVHLDKPFRYRPDGPAPD